MPSCLKPLKQERWNTQQLLSPVVKHLERQLSKGLKSSKRLWLGCICGECPKYIDIKSDRVKDLYSISETVPFERASILSALENEKVIDIKNEDGTLTDNLIYNMRQDNNCNWLFIAHGVKTLHVDAVKMQKIIIKIRGEYTPKLYDTINGIACDIDFKLKDGNTIINTEINCHDSILLRLGEKTTSYKISNKPKRTKIGEINFKNRFYKRSEPNVLLLDTAQYAFDDGKFNDAEEILRIDNIFRENLATLHAQASCPAMDIKRRNRKTFY